MSADTHDLRQNHADGVPRPAWGHARAVRLLKSLAGSLVAAVLLVGCIGTPEVPRDPTWSDVEPILRGQCNHCHGSTATTTGLGYRFEFFDMDPTVCGDAALALPTSALAGVSALLMATDIVPAEGAPRARMPPIPARELADWERLTIQRWAANPVKGPPPPGNHLPTMQVTELPATVDTRLRFGVVLADADGQAIVGVIRVGDVLTYGMDRSGSFIVDVDATTWPGGTFRITATLCDGWQSQALDLGPITVSHSGGG